MKLFPVVVAAAFTLAACGESKVETPSSEAGTKVSIKVSGDDDAAPGDAAATAESTVQIDGDSDTGKFEIRLPGGIEAKVKVPEGFTNGARFDIDGVGLYPGGKVRTVNVDARADARAEQPGTSSTVAIGFSAPADAAAVADWYQQQFEARKVAFKRSGETLTGITEAGDRFTLALSQAATGSTGMLKIVDIDRG